VNFAWKLGSVNDGKNNTVPNAKNNSRLSELSPCSRAINSRSDAAFHVTVELEIGVNCLICRDLERFDAFLLESRDIDDDIRG
jgi:hypothetical protein